MLLQCLHWENPPGPAVCCWKTSWVYSDTDDQHCSQMDERIELAHSAAWWKCRDWYALLLSSKLNKEDAVDRCKWRKVIKEVRLKEVHWPGWVWAGECFFWYRPTRVVPDKRLLNGCCCCWEQRRLEANDVTLQPNGILRFATHQWQQCNTKHTRQSNNCSSSKVS